VKTSKIEWTDATWNPVTGCTPISRGCDHCYAARMAERLRAMGSSKYANGFDLTIHSELFDEPLRWTKPRRVFVCSMSDLFHEDVPVQVIQRVFETMNKANWHTFQVLTKRAERLAQCADLLTWSPNIWAGVTVESSRYVSRIDALGRAPAAIRFVSFEPLIDSVSENIGDLNGIDWAIVGGESGPGARPMNYQWVLSLKDVCDLSGTAFFFKQWGGVNKKKNGSLLLGRKWKAMPEGWDYRKETAASVPF